MVTTWILAVALQSPVGPTLPPGANEHVHRANVTIQTRLAQRDFAGAERALRLWPKAQVTVRWDDSKVPAILRSEFADARERAFRNWSRLFRDFEGKVGPDAEIKISFADRLPPNPDSDGPAGAVFFFSEAPNEPRVEAVIALRRGKAARPAELTDVANEVGHAIALYLGLARTTFNGSFSSRSDAEYRMVHNPMPSELNAVRRILAVGEELRGLARERQSIQAARPRLQISPLRFEPRRGRQGDVFRYSVSVSNLGNAPLLLRAVPDCGCLTTRAPRELAPGGTTTLPIAMDTTDFVGNLIKNVHLYSNDPDAAMRTIRMTAFARPLYRLLSPAGSVAVVGPQGGSHDFFFFADRPEDFEPISARYDGVDAAVEVSSWQGRLADPELSEKALPRRGYRLRVTFRSGAVPPGRSLGSVVVSTGSEKFGTLRSSLAVQSGIVALPEQVSLGEIARGPRRASFLISRPNRPFKITRITANSPFLSFRQEPLPIPGEYRIWIQYNGRSDAGLISADIQVHTDDPRQKTLRVPFRAVVR